MTKTNRKLKVKDSILSLLTQKGYFPNYSDEEDAVQIDCIIAGTSFAFFYEQDKSYMGYGVVFEPDDPVSDDEFDLLKQDFAKEKTPFSDCLKDEFGLIHLYGEISSEDCSEEFVDKIIKTIEKKDGIVAKLKSISFIWEG